jgi:hypothetical protein
MMLFLAAEGGAGIGACLLVRGYRLERRASPRRKEEEEQDVEREVGLVEVGR